MKQNTMLMIGGAIVVYLLWKKSQETSETASGFSNVGGGPYTQSSGSCFCSRNSDGTGTLINCPCGDNPQPHPDGVGGGITAPTYGGTRRLRRR